MDNFVNQWGALLESLIFPGPNTIAEVNSRTGRLVHIARGSRTIQLDLANGSLPTCGLRKTHPASAAAETAWQFLGHDHTDWLRRHTKMWDKFTDEVECTPCDGSGKNGDFACTPCSGTGKRHFTQFAYGYRWRNRWRDQIYHLINALRNDPSDRRTTVLAWDPNCDGLGAPNQKNVPCPIGFNAHIVGGELHMGVTLRSSDAFVGLPYDVMTYALTADAIAASLNVTPGVLTLHLDNSHLYDVHFDMATKCLIQRRVLPTVKLPRWSVDQITTFSDTYVEQMKDKQKAEKWPEYNPFPEVVA